MNTRKITSLFCLGFIAFFSISTLLHAQTQPKFTIIPRTQTNIIVPKDQVAVVAYTLTNQTLKTRQLVIVLPSNPGLTLNTQGAGSCSNPVVLAHNQSCNIILNISGAQLTSTINSAPVKVCKTTSSSDHNPDPFLCSQTSQNDNLSISAPNLATISVTPKLLILNANSPNTPGQLTVTNNSSSLTALNIQADITGTSLEANVTQTSTCASVRPGQSCTLTFTPGDTAISTTYFPIYGTNTTTTNAAIRIVKPPTTAQITITSGAYLVLTSPGGTGTMTVTNNTRTITATNIVANLTQELTIAGVTVDESTACASLPYQGTCTLTFTAGSTSTTVSPQNITVQGSNTSIADATVEVETTPIMLMSLQAPTGLSMPFDDFNPQYLTIENTGTLTIPSITADLSSTALNGSVYLYSNNCQNLAVGATCQLGFALDPTATSIIPPTEFPITGTGDTNTLIGTISVGTAYAFIANPDKLNIIKCAINPNENANTPLGSLSGCATALTSSLLTAPHGLVVDSTNNLIYISNSGSSITSNTLVQCSIRYNGDLTNCISTAALFDSPIGLSLDPTLTTLYITDGSFQNVYRCPTSSFSSCNPYTTAAATTLVDTTGFVINSDGSHAYAVGYNPSSNHPNSCVASGGGNFTCNQSNTPVIGQLSSGIVVNANNTQTYISSTNDNNVFQCAITGGNLSNASVATNLNAHTYGVAINAANTFVYFTTDPASGTQVFQCTIDNTEALSSCVNSGASFTSGFLKGIAVWEPDS